MSNTTFIYGLHSVEASLKKHPDRVLELLIQMGREDAPIKNILSIAKQSQISIQHMGKDKLDALTGNANHQGVVANMRAAAILNENDLEDLLDQTQNPFLLILDCVQDPHNLGACLRTADALGVHAVIVPKDKSAGLTPAVRKVACGAAETVPFVQVTNLSRTMKMLKDRDIWLVGAAGEAKDDLTKTKLPKPIAVVMGAEGAGLRRLTKDNCDLLVKIPMFGMVESLNVSVATGIFLFCAKR